MSEWCEQLIKGVIVGLVGLFADYMGHGPTGMQLNMSLGSSIS